LDAIARPGGGLAMVAMDQRESLRAMLVEAGRPADDAALTAFKIAVARQLGPLASGFLIDRHYAYPTVRTERLLSADTGLILAVDDLEQAPGGPVTETRLDEVALAPGFDREGVVAVKLLIVWRRDERRIERARLAAEFCRRAAGLGLLSVLEPVVRPTAAEDAAGTFDLDEAICEAAAELSTSGQSLYKVQVPRSGRGTPAELREACAAVDAAIRGPWVVLSQGVAREDFLPAVTAACQGGASGFLAGRALWSDVVAADDVSAALTERAVPRLQRLIEVVDQHAHPWSGS
jgi:sulfofructosephosphate aldolase